MHFCKRICEVRIHLFKCVCKNAFVPKWSLGRLPLRPDAVCAWSHAVLPLKRATFGKWTLWVSFSPLKTSQVREDKAVRTYFCPVCRSLLCHQTTKPLALVPSAVSVAWSWAGGCLWKGPGLPSSWVWLQGAVSLGKQCSSWPPASLLRFSPPVTLQHCLLSSWCSWAKLELELELMLCGSCLGSGPHVPWRLSRGNANILLLMLLPFKVFKKQTDTLLISTNELLG